MKNVIEKGLILHLYNKFDSTCVFKIWDNNRRRTMKERYQSNYRESWALVIGINEYKHINQLEYARQDAEAIAEILISKFQFSSDKVIKLTDEQATKEAILKNYLQFTKPHIDENDRILIFFAGHGHTITGNRNNVGYLIPVDGKLDDISTYIRWDELTRNSDLIKAKHIFFIMDACFSGSAITRSLSQGCRRYLSNMLQRYSRQVLTAGKADEVVADANGPIPQHSIFTGHLLQALNGGVESPDGIITANVIMSYVGTKVSTDQYSNQSPHYGYFDGDGDFVFNVTVQNSSEKQDALIEAPNIDKNFAYIKEFIQKGKIDLESIYDELADDEKGFQDTPPIVSGDDSCKYYTHSHLSVYLSGILPCYPKISASCSMAFRSLKIRGCIIDLTAKDLSIYFIKGLYTDPILEMRPFIKNRNAENAMQYWINFGNITFTLSLFELQHLCDVIDGFISAYLKSLRHIEEKLGVQNMQFSKVVKGGYRLLKIKEKLWKELISFSIEHVSETGSSPWNIFEATPFKLKIYTREDDKRFISGYHAILEFERDKEYNEEEGWVVWSPCFFDFDENEPFSKQKRWNPAISLTWLTKEYMPYVYSKCKSLQMEKLDYYISDVASIVDEYLNCCDLLNLVNNLRNFYSANFNMFVSKKEFEGLILAICEGLRNVPSENCYDYVTSSLGYARSTTNEEILNKLTIKRSELKDHSVPASTIDSFLRAFGFILEKENKIESKLNIKYVVNCLQPLVECKINQELADKYAEF